MDKNRDEMVIESILKKLDQLSKEVSALKIDKQLYVEANVNIAPGIATKIAFDDKGLVLRGMVLEPSDIPELPISHITGLKDSLNTYGNVDTKKIVNEIKDMIPRKGSVVGTATKVNFDENGLVVSSSNLTADDIPNLPMDKISGLTDLIEIINSMSDSKSVAPAGGVVDFFKSGTFTKVSVDSLGRVINGERLSTSDLPIDLINRVIQLEKNVSELAPMTLVDKISKSLMDKVDTNPSTKFGTFTKVVVDTNGLVVGNEKLTVDDLPELSIDLIPGLRSILNKAATNSDIIKLNDSMSSILGSIQSIGDINQVKASLSLKAEADDVTRLRHEFDSFSKSVAQREENFPYELILKRLDMIDESISTIEGRISVLEKELMNKK